MIITRWCLKVESLFDKIKNDIEVKRLLLEADNTFASIGYKDHGIRHAELSANIAYNILKFLNYDELTCELTKIGAYLHDIGNAFGMESHPQTGAVFSLDILMKHKIELKNIIVILNAIGSHEDKQYPPVSEIAAATILADKTDIHRSRVRKKYPVNFDMHDLVNYACTHSFLKVENKVITLELSIDEEIARITQYFEIFLPRIHHCQLACKKLDCKFSLFINNVQYI